MPSRRMDELSSASASWAQNIGKLYATPLQVFACNNMGLLVAFGKEQLAEEGESLGRRHCTAVLPLRGTATLEAQESHEGRSSNIAVQVCVP